MIILLQMIFFFIYSVYAEERKRESYCSTVFYFFLLLQAILIQQSIDNFDTFIEEGKDIDIFLSNIFFKRAFLYIIFITCYHYRLQAID